MDSSFFLFFYWQESIRSALVATLVVLLTANFINLLDLRPGRALKTFLILLLIIMFLKQEVLFLVFPILILVLFSLPFDLKAKGMMGDVGANILGSILGILIVINFSFRVEILILFCLFFLHIYAEFNSFTKLINNNRILNFIDKLGRR